MEGKIFLGLLDVSTCLNIKAAKKRKEEKKIEFSNRLDPDEAAHNELPHLNLHCSPSNLLILDIASMEHFLKLS